MLQSFRNVLAGTRLVLGAGKAISRRPGTDAAIAAQVRHDWSCVPGNYLGRREFPRATAGRWNCPAPSPNHLKSPTWNAWSVMFRA